VNINPIIANMTAMKNINVKGEFLDKIFLRVKYLGFNFVVSIQEGISFNI